MNSDASGTPVFVRIALWLLFGAAAAGVLYYSFRPGPGLSIFMWRDKFQHMAAYGTLALLATLAARGRGQAVLCVMLIAAAGYLIELLQPLAGRSYDLLDEGFNILGCTAGFILARLTIRTWHAVRTA